MNAVYEFLKKCGTFYLATEENGQPHVRPFGAVCMFEGKLYIVTNNQKKVYLQMIKNGNLRYEQRKMDASGRNRKKGLAP